LGDECDDGQASERVEVDTTSICLRRNVAMQVAVLLSIQIKICVPRITEPVEGLGRGRGQRRRIFTDSRLLVVSSPETPPPHHHTADAAAQQLHGMGVVVARALRRRRVGTRWNASRSTISKQVSVQQCSCAHTHATRHRNRNTLPSEKHGPMLLGNSRRSS
jgi:hypothetical protein